MKNEIILKLISLLVFNLILFVLIMLVITGVCVYRLDLNMYDVFFTEIIDGQKLAQLRLFIYIANVFAIMGFIGTNMSEIIKELNDN